MRGAHFSFLGRTSTFFKKTKKNFGYEVSKCTFDTLEIVPPRNHLHQKKGNSLVFSLELA
jgi:hypothetical protein